MKIKQISLSRSLFLSIISCLMFNATMYSNVKMPQIFGDHMVLQRDLEIPVWGWADPGEKITVEFNSTKVKAKTDKDGKWMVKLPSIGAGGPFELTISGKNKIAYTDVMVGDVWICSGQSNMEWSLIQSLDGENAVKYSSNSNIRLLNVINSISLEPLDDINTTGWAQCSPESVASFSAVGYYFGNYLNKELNIPIGLIGSNWGGTIIESWTSEESCQDNEFLKEWFERIKGLNLDELLAKEKEKIKLYKAELEKVNAGDGNSHPLAKENLDYSSWKNINVPGLWEEKGIGNFDGIVWMRRSIVIPENFDLNGIELYLGKIDDSDICWINGKRVGETYNQYALQRKYKLPEGLLKKGKNEIVVRIEDYTGGGGIYGDANMVYLTNVNEKIPLSGEWKYKIDETPVAKDVNNPEANVLEPNDYPTLLFNGMIAPLIPYGIKGSIWYQGESNADFMEEAKMYPEMMSIMINDWRKHWNQGDFPFFMVQLANYMRSDQKPADHPWAHLREAQFKTTQTIPNVGMACIIDIGEANDIHPKNKKDVGYRLSLSALKIAYGKDIVYSGPVFESVKYEGNKAIVTYSHVANGLVVNNKYGYINGFAVAGNDKQFAYAKAKTINKNTVEVTSDKIKDIKAVRYAWAVNPDDVNLYNSEDLPAVPFRTDSW